MPQLLRTTRGSFTCWHDVIARTLAEGRDWDAHLFPLIDQAEPKGWAIDLGANIGWFTVYMAQRFLHVVAVEAHPQTYQLLVQNVTAHGVWRRVQPYQFAAYDCMARLRIADPALMGFPVPHALNLDQTDGASSIAFVGEAVPQLEGCQVFAGPVDDLIPSTAPVTLIKCDVQGCDLRALKGLERTIRRCRPLILFEWEEAMSGWHGDQWNAYLTFFDQLGYTVERICMDYWDYVARPR